MSVTLKYDPSKLKNSRVLTENIIEPYITSLLTDIIVYAFKLKQSLDALENIYDAYKNDDIYPNEKWIKSIEVNAREYQEDLEDVIRTLRKVYNFNPPDSIKYKFRIERVLYKIKAKKSGI